jgi:predicted TIM-barrel fold metal-dependent hydrolase
MTATESKPTSVERKLSLVDVDIHAGGAPLDRLKELMPARSRAEVDDFGYLLSRWIAGWSADWGFGGGAREDAVAEPGESELDLLRRQVLDEYGVDYGILTTYNLFERARPELATDGARAINDGFMETLLEPEPRLLGSIAIAWEQPELAVREIEDRAGDRRWANVMMPAEALEPLGSRRYWPIYEAAAAHGLPLARHVGWGRALLNSAGKPSYVFERHLTLALDTQCQLLNIVCSGVLDAIEGVRIVMIEGGAVWAAAMRWALDSAVDLFGRELRLERKPSEYFDESIWFSTQPIEEPRNESDFERALSLGNLGHRLMFSSDYPHWDFDSPKVALPRSLDDSLRDAIMAGTASALYGLPR